MKKPTVRCKKHPLYKGVYFPTAKVKGYVDPCGACRIVYYLRHVGESLHVELTDGTTLVFEV